MDTSIWVNLAVLTTALLTNSVLVVIFMYREFATKKDLAVSETHLRELMHKDNKMIMENIALIHKSIGNLECMFNDFKKFTERKLFRTNEE